MPLLRQAMGGWTARKGCVCMDIMQAILDIEDKAKEIVESADEVKAQQQEKFRDALEKMQADAKEKTQDEIASLQKTLDNLRGRYACRSLVIGLGLVPRTRQKGRSIISVSYTHLDVYKRQAIIQRRTTHHAIFPMKPLMSCTASYKSSP